MCLVTSILNLFSISLNLLNLSTGQELFTTVVVVVESVMCSRSMICSRAERRTSGTSRLLGRRAHRAVPRVRPALRECRPPEEAEPRTREGIEFVLSANIFRSSISQYLHSQINAFISLTFAQTASEISEYNVQSMFYELEHRAPFQPAPPTAAASSSSSNGDSRTAAETVSAAESSGISTADSSRDAASSASPSDALEQRVAELQLSDSERAARASSAAQSAESGGADEKLDASPKRSPTSAPPAGHSSTEAHPGPDSGAKSASAATGNGSPASASASGAQQWSSDPNQYGAHLKP